MIKNTRLVDIFEKILTKNSPPDFERNLAVFDELYEEARIMGIFPLKDPMEDMDSKIFMVRVLNAL
ncbi:hypothetical protein LLG96_07105 [bacterium]|nr:hypothetical protein [bacterium]